MAETEQLSELVATADAVRAISESEDQFRAVFDAFRAGDADTWGRLLGEAKVSDRAESLCWWLCSKDCVLRCIELCGPPVLEDVPDLREFGELIVRLALDEELVERLAQSVLEPDPSDWKRLVEELKIERFCHLLCHWVCSVHCRIRCLQLDPGATGPVRHLVDELAAAGAAIRDLLANESAFAEAAKAAELGDCIRLRTALDEAKLSTGCHWICEWFCTWRCVRVCVTLCRPFLEEVKEFDLSEAYAFARAVGRLTDQPDLLDQLAQAVETADAERWSELLTKLELRPFCIQLCHWLCYRHCQLLCRCVCNPARDPMFTQIGHFNIDFDIATATGLTNKGLPFAGLGHHGGPGFAFFGDLELRGYVPAASPIDGTAMKYRFLVTAGGGTNAVTGSRVATVDVGTRPVPWPARDATNTTIPGVMTVNQPLQIAGAPQVEAPPPAVGDPWVPPDPHVLVPDGDGWVVVDPSATVFTTLMGLRSTEDVPGGPAAPTNLPGAAATPARVGADIGLTFEATRVSRPSASPPEYTNGVGKVHVNNWSEANQVFIQQFATPGTGACTPIDASLDVDYTADHELMADWSLSITSASPSAPGVVASGNVPRGGNGTVSENTTTWDSCSYTVTLSVRAGLTTGLADNSGYDNPTTFCIGRHKKNNG
jgi:hypothetical protein